MFESIQAAAVNKPFAADRYPFLPARMWNHGIPAEAASRLNRVLSEQEFMFREEPGAS